MPAACRTLKILLCAMLTLQMLSSGCKYFSCDPPQYYISLHELATDDRLATQMSRIVWDPQQEKQAQVNIYSFLDAKRFVSAEIIPDANKQTCGIRLYFDRFGSNLLLQTTAAKQGQRFAVLIDGFFIGLSRFPSHATIPSYIELDPLWSVMEAEQIAERVNKNYQHLNN